MPKMVVFTKSALRDLKGVPKRDRAVILQRIEVAAVDPQAAGETRVKNADGQYRVRQGDYRAVYEKSAAELRVLLIGHRKDVYAKLRCIH